MGTTTIGPTDAHAARPLAGRTIVVTRPRAQAASLVALLEQAGARVLEAATIEIEPPESWTPLDSALDRLDDFAWVVFTSVNGVGMVDRRLRERDLAWSAIAAKRVAAIGPATAAALERHAVHVTVVPDEYRAEGLVARLRELIAPSDRVLLPRAAETRDVLVRELERLSAEVVEVPAYRTRRVTDAAERLRAAVAAGEVDAITFTSSSTARGVAELFTPDERTRWFGRVAIAAIGPITAATAAEYGLHTDVMPSEYTIPALARAIAEHFAAASRARRAGEGS